MFASETDHEEAFHERRAPNASGAGGRFALAGAKCERRLPARYGPAPEVPGSRTGRPGPAVSTGRAGTAVRRNPGGYP